MAGHSSFTFVNTSKPGEALTPENRKLIRGNATLRRQQKNRRDSGEKKRNNVFPPDHLPLSMPQSPSSGSMQEHMWSMLKYQETVVGPSLFPLKVLHDLNPGQRIMMCMALSDDKVLNAAVAIASLRIRLIEKLPALDSQRWHTTALRHKQEALKLVKAHMSANRDSYIDVPTALSMMHLATLEFMVLNEDGWNAHRMALKQLVRHPNSRSAVKMARYTIFDVDAIGCYMFNKQPVFSLDDLAPDHTALDTCDQPIKLGDVTILTNMHSHVTPTTGLDETVQTILDRMRDIDYFISQGTHNSYLQIHVQTYLDTRTLIEHTIFDLLHQDNLDYQSRTVCHAAQIYINQAYRTFGKGSEIPHRIALRLRDSMIEVIEEVLNGHDLDASMLWAAMMGGIGTRDTEIRKFFISTISIFSSELGLTTWPAIHEQLTKMPWSEEYLGTECKLLWEEAQRIWELVGL